MLKQFFVLLLLTAAMFSCRRQEKKEIPPAGPATTAADDSLFQLARNFFKPLPAVADNKDNPVTAAKVKLGKYLFYDTRLSKAGNISCNSCHNLLTYGVDQKAVSTGDAGQQGTRNSPTVFNAALHNMQFWDGRASDVEEQAGMPILNPAEMAIPHKGFLLNRLDALKLYHDLFKEAFPGEEKPISYPNLQKAIAAFERTLLTPSRFDQFMNGDRNAIFSDEKAGLKLFISSGCVACHNGVGIGGGSLQRFGVITDFRTLTSSKKADVGREKLTKDKADRDKFKVAGLRNVAGTYPYFHDGSIARLDSAVQIMGKTQFNKTFSKAEIKQLVAFLNCLTGDISQDAKTIPAELVKK